MSAAPPPRRRPPWWPGDQPWPPRAERRGPPLFIRRLVFFAFAFLLLVAVLSAISGFFLAGREREGPPPFAGLFVILLVVGGFFAFGRIARRFTGPVAQVMDGLDRLASGDYAVRVNPVGPPAMRSLASALNTTAARLETAEEQRRNLTADIAHEVRTPLAVIRGNVEGMLDGLYPADEAHLGPILEEVRVITRLVEDLGTLSSAEAGMLRLHPEPTAIAGLLGDLQRSFLAQCTASAVSLSVEAPAGLVLEIDSQRVRQVLENLVTNSLRHTPPGGSIRIAARGEGAGVTIQVADTGSGIPAEELPHIFERYRKAPGSGGSGLGLAIARRLVEAHGGTIEATSEVGQGTTISFSLPGPVG